MPITTTLPDWLATGVQPPESLRTNGWEEGQKPAAEYFNWFFSTSYYALNDLAEKAASQQDFDNHKNNQTNPHQVKKAQVGLGNVDNVKQVSKTEFDSHNQNRQNPHGVTASQVGASPTGHGHSGATTTTSGFMSGVDKTKLNAMPAASDVETKAGATQKADDAEQSAIDWVKYVGLGGSLNAHSYSEDLNALNETQIVYALNATNSPAGNGFIIHMSYNNDYKKQLFYKVTGNQFYARFRDADGWKSWTEHETTAGAQAKADERVEKTGDTMTGDLNFSGNSFPHVSSDEYFVLTSKRGTYIASNAYFDNAWKRHDPTSDSVLIELREDQGGVQVKTASAGSGDISWKSENLETEKGTQAKVDATQVHRLTNDDGSAFGYVSDANTVKTTGIYNTSASTANIPSAASSLLIVQDRSTNIISQQLIYYSANTMHFRTSINNGVSWSNWEMIETTDGAQAKVDTVDSDQVNMESNNFKTASARGDEYPFGLTVFRTDDNTFPQQWGIVQTSRGSNYLSQIFFATGNSIYQRVWDVNTNSWKAWNTLETTTGAQERADAVDSEQVTHIGVIDGSQSGNTYPVGVTMFDWANNITYPFNYGTALNVKDNDNRFVQTIYHNQGTEAPQQRYWYNNAWSAWKKLPREGDDVSFKSVTVGGVNLKQSVSNGKQQVRDAVIGKGGTVADADSDGIPTFQELMDGVNGITTSPINSMQRGEAKMLGTTRLVSISAVDLPKSIVRITGLRFDDGTSTEYFNPPENFVLAEFTSSTEISFMVRDFPEDVRPVVMWEVVEFVDDVRVSKGKFSMDETGTFSKIFTSSFDSNKAMLYYTYKADDITSSDVRDIYIAGRVYGTNYIEFTRAVASYPYTIQWFLVVYP